MHGEGWARRGEGGARGERGKQEGDTDEHRLAQMNTDGPGAGMVLCARHGRQAKNAAATEMRPASRGALMCLLL